MSKKTFIIAIVICLVALGILVYIVVDHNRKPSDVVIDGSELEGVLSFSGLSVFSENYIGDFESKEITAKLQELIKEDIPKLYENTRKLDDKEVKKYYNDNQTSIKNKFGIQTEEEFINFSNKISQTKIKLNSWDKVKVNQDSFISQSDKTNYAYMEFDVIYENEEKMSFSVYIANRKLMSPQFIFIAK